MTTNPEQKLIEMLCTRCHQPPEQVGRGDGCNDPWCPYKRTPTKIKDFPGREVEEFRKSHNGNLPSEYWPCGHKKEHPQDELCRWCSP